MSPAELIDLLAGLDPRTTVTVWDADRQAECHVSGVMTETSVGYAMLEADGPVDDQ